MDSKCLYCGTYDLDACKTISESLKCSNLSDPHTKPALGNFPCGYTKTEPQTKPLTGGSSDYYKIPVGAKDLLDLIEHKNMSFGLGNIFKACYRLGEKMGTSRKYDLEKIIFFAQRELDRVST
jgi:hypothetical protein